MKTCIATGKRRYPTKVACLLANSRRPTIARAYRCSHCRSWHLTKQPQN